MGRLPAARSGASDTEALNLEHLSVSPQTNRRTVYSDRNLLYDGWNSYGVSL